jgi:hypothetical protein
VHLDQQKAPWFGLGFEATWQFARELESCAVPNAISIRRASVGRVHDAALFYVAAELSRRNLKVERVFVDAGLDLEVERRGDSRHS